MLSILIPTYHYNAFPLAAEIHRQCTEANVAFEIICHDDASDSKTNQENARMNDLPFASFDVNPANLGRGMNINSLFEKSKYPWAIILDSDTFPESPDFIKNYLAAIENDARVAFGGITYSPDKPSEGEMLRWIYGRRREAVPVERRRQNPYATALTSNLLIHKDIFSKNLFCHTITEYGYEDMVFSAMLKHKGVEILHIENPARHLNLETSKIFLGKTETALRNLASLSKAGRITTEESVVLRTFERVRKLHLHSGVAFFFKRLKKVLEENLLSANPRLFYFDLYKIGYFCSINSR